MYRMINRVMLAVLMVCVVVGVTEAAPRYRWSFAQPWTRPLADRGYQLFIDRVREYTDGAIEITLFPAGLLGTHDESFHGVRDGSIEISVLSPYVSIVPGGMMNWMPWTISSFDEARIAYSYPDGIIFRVMREAWREVNAELLFSVSQGAYGFGNNTRPLRLPDDLDGLKMRVSASLGAVRTLGNMGSGTGMTMETIPWAEIYNALARGVVDGIWSMWPSLLDERHAEVLTYYTHVGWTWDANNVVINRELWDSLEPRYQHAIRRAAAAAEQYLNDLHEMAERGFVERLETEFDNLTITWITPEEQAVWRERADMASVWAEIADPWLESVWPGQNKGEYIRAQLDAVREQVLSRQE